MSEEFGSALAERFPEFVAVTAKWREEDLIAGLSDLDTRIVCREMTPARWTEVDRVVGEEHLREAVQHPSWARILEHTPGVCMTASEMVDPQVYHPDARHWGLYYGDRAAWDQMESTVQSWPWSARDEQYYLKRFATFYGPYDRTIDPPINIEPSLERRYSWHSRAMHYFVPPLQAALCLLTRRNVKGKRESLRGWLERCPEATVLDETADMVACGYDVPWADDDGAMFQYEARCAAFLDGVLEELKPVVSEVDLEPCGSIEEVRAAVGKMQADPMMILFDGVRFSRVRLGRYHFYLNAPGQFDASRLITYEAAWLQRLFTRSVLQSYVRVRGGPPDSSLDDALALLADGVLDKRAVEVVRQVNELAFRDNCDARVVLEEVSAVYGEYHVALELMLADARRVPVS
jgi:hypothetical protein